MEKTMELKDRALEMLIRILRVLIALVFIFLISAIVYLGFSLMPDLVLTIFAALLIIFIILKSARFF
jgi:uncharacterized membrane protein YjgN (DUF898 family)